MMLFSSSGYLLCLCRIDKDNMNIRIGQTMRKAYRVADRTFHMVLLDKPLFKTSFMSSEFAATSDWILNFLRLDWFETKQTRGFHLERDSTKVFTRLL